MTLGPMFVCISVLTLVMSHRKCSESEHKKPTNPWNRLEGNNMLFQHHTWAQVHL